MSFIYNKKDAKCMWCKRTRNPHKDFNETIPTKIFISHNISSHAPIRVQWGNFNS